MYDKKREYETKNPLFQPLIIPDMHHSLTRPAPATPSQPMNQETCFIEISGTYVSILLKGPIYEDNSQKNFNKNKFIFMVDSFLTL